MITFNKKGVKYATWNKVSAEMVNDISEKRAVQMIKAMPSFRLPKNTLKVVYTGYKIGLDGNDFVRNVKTVVLYYIVYTFKR